MFVFKNKWKHFRPSERARHDARIKLLKLGVKISSAKSSYLLKHNNDSFEYHNYEKGYYFDYNYRSENYSNIDGSICKNNQEYEGIVFHKIKCPVEGFSVDAVLCCDEPGQQFCCVPAKNSFIFIVLGIFLLGLFGGKIFFLWRVCRYRCSKNQEKNDNPEEEINLNQASKFAV